MNGEREREERDEGEARGATRRTSEPSGRSLTGLDVVFLVDVHLSVPFYSLLHLSRLSTSRSSQLGRVATHCQFFLHN